MTPKPWTPPGEGWIEHRPGDACPVAAASACECLIRAERDEQFYESEIRFALDWFWNRQRDRDDDIVAYRIVKSREELEAENAALRAQLGRIACYSLSSPREFTERERLSDLARRAYELVGIAAQALHIGETK